MSLVASRTGPHEVVEGGGMGLLLTLKARTLKISPFYYSYFSYTCSCGFTVEPVLMVN